MPGNKSDSWFYPKPTGDPGRDRNARTIQFASLLLALAMGVNVIFTLIDRNMKQVPVVALSLFVLVAAIVTNRAGKWALAGILAFSGLLVTAMLLVFEARDGLRSTAMLLFPGILLLCVLLLDRLAYTITAGLVLIAVAALGIAERHGLTHAIFRVRSPTTYETIFYVDFLLLVLAIIGSRISRDTQKNVQDLRTTINHLSETNLELKQTADAWRSSERQLDSLYNTVGDPIFHLNVEPDGQYRFVSVNASFLRVTGLGREMVVGKTVNDVIPEPSLTLVLGKYKKAIEEKTEIIWEETSDYPSGRLTGIVCVVPNFDEDGTCTFLAGSVHDITDLRHEQTADFAKQKLESLGTLAAGIAHDFNNLMGAVLVQTETALLGLASGSTPEAELRVIRDVAVRGADVVRQLMTYAGKESPVAGLVDVSQTMKEMLAFLKVSVSKHARFEMQLGKDLPLVKANAAQLQQVMMNLVTNASDAIGDQDGEIRITTSCVKVKQNSWAVPHGLQEGDHVQVEVSDTGCGMSPEMQVRVFDPFFTTKSPGHGLGLSIIHGIIRGMNGAIQVLSEPGKGTRVQILLPRAETLAGETSGTTADTTDQTSQPTQATVLVVEDETYLRQAVVKMLRRSGFEVLEAADGMTAIDLVRMNKDNIDLILLDMTIPGPSSTEVITEAGKLCPEAGVILTSAYSAEMLADTLKRPQIRSFIRKPFRLADLVTTIRDNLQDVKN